MFTDYGADIDSQECVIRLNNAPIGGYESDVGRRTTLRVVAHNALYAKLEKLYCLVYCFLYFSASFTNLLCFQRTTDSYRCRETS